MFCLNVTRGMEGSVCAKEPTKPSQPEPIPEVVEKSQLSPCVRVREARKCVGRKKCEKGRENERHVVAGKQRGRGRHMVGKFKGVWKRMYTCVRGERERRVCRWCVVCVRTKMKSS